MNSNTPAPWWANYLLAAAVLAVFAGALAAVLKMGNETQVTTMITAAVALTMGAVGYFYNSSAGSARKDQDQAVASAKAIDALAVSAPIAPNPPPAGG